MRRKLNDPEIEKRGDFEPRLPRTMHRVKGGVLGRLKQMARASSGSKAKRVGRRSKGARGKARAPRAYGQRVIVKARVVKADGKKAVQRLRAHISYLNRSGTGLMSDRPEFFNQERHLTREELSKEAPKWAKDAHHFRFIVSPERGSELELEAYVKSLLETMESDLKTKLQWYATCHYNTDNPHAHVVIRGVDERGEVLLLARDYLSHGVRHIAEREATVRLGVRSPGEVQRGIEKALKEERFTFMDAELSQMQERTVDKTLKLEPLWGVVREWERKGRENRIKRLAALETMGLAKELRAGVWKLDDNLEKILKEISERRRIEKLISPLLSHLEARKQELVIHRESESFGLKIRGLVVAKELSDELHNKRFILLNAEDGRTHFIPLGRFSEPDGFECKAGQIVRVAAPKEHAVRVEKVISQYLGGIEGVFEVGQFRDYIKQAASSGKWSLPEAMNVDDYLKLFITRCETLSRAGVLKDLGNGMWHVPRDVEDRTKVYEGTARKKLRVSVTVDSFLPLGEQVTSQGAVWLDRLIETPEALSQLAGSYRLEIERALIRRKEEISKLGIKPQKGVFYDLLSRDEKTLRTKLESRLGREEILRVGEDLRGTVIGYELLGDGYRMVAKTEDGFVLRKVGRREAQLPLNSEVTLSKTAKVINGRTREVIKARPVEGVRALNRTKRRR